VLVEPHSSIATGLCSFFWKNAKGNLSKKTTFTFWQSSKKIERTIKDLSVKLGCRIYRFRLFWKVQPIENEVFFSIENKNCVNPI
jgi:hypothetical protein